MTTRKNAKGQGRKKQPESQKQLSGSRHQNAGSVTFEPITYIEPPEWLEPLAVEMWQTVCPDLCKHKILSVNDAHLLEAFCSEYARWRQATDEYKTHGPVMTTPSGAVVKNPAGTVINETLRNITQYGSQLGLSPSARSGLMGLGDSGGGNRFDGV